MWNLSVVRGGHTTLYSLGDPADFIEGTFKTGDCDIEFASPVSYPDKYTNTQIHKYSNTQIHKYEILQNFARQLMDALATGSWPLASGS